MQNKTFLRIVALISGISGIVILVGVIYPIVSYNTIYASKYTSLISPVTETVNQVQGAITDTVNGNTTDYTQASTWFAGGATRDAFSGSKVDYYTLSIPKLKIKDAIVAIGGEDLTHHVIQYPGTALPGKRGNAVLFGHSILPIFYNPSNYLAIFSLLPTLKPGDEINVNYDGISYVYNVETMFEVLPTDIQVLDQDSSDSFLTLVTCVPPGDPRNPKRLIVRARVVPPR
ncbi:MAG TPA: sortase [Alphaproteobacteria bacterium]|jgi:sortase A|nr:sortase [Alphaproteobacteria bacterium]